MGKNSIYELLHFNSSQIVCVFTCQKEGDLIRELNKKKVKISFTSKQKLSSLVDSDSHQSYVAEIKNRNFSDLKMFLKQDKERSLVVMCDSITDPQNFGAIMRASECFGVDALIWSKNRNVGITPVVSKVSAGASELLTLIPVSNLGESVRQCQKEGYFVVALEKRPFSKSIRSLNFPKKAVIILGSEGKGIQPLLSKAADELIEIPMSGRIDSLNVSQAAAVCLAAYWR